VTRTLATALLAAAALFACKKPEKQGPVLATVGDERITADDLNRRIEETHVALRQRFSTPERRKDFLENMIRNELLAQEARRRGLDKAPAVQEQLKRIMVSELLRQQFDEKLRGADIPEPELRKFYDSHVDDYVKPERMRINHLLVAAPAGDARKRAAARAKAQRLLQEINDREAKGETNAFAVVAMKESNDAASAPLGGDLRYLSRVEMEREQGAELAAAAFQLGRPGDKAGPIETPKGFELIKLQNKTIALDKKFGDVRDQVRQRMAVERRNRDYEDFMKGLRERSAVKIFPEELAKMPAPDLTPGSPRPPPVASAPK